MAQRSRSVLVVFVALILRPFAFLGVSRDSSLRHSKIFLRKKCTYGSVSGVVPVRPVCTPVHLQMPEKMPIADFSISRITPRLTERKAVMASYAIYLYPKEESLKQALEDVPQARQHVEKVQERGHWGGKLHMTLSRFAGINGEAPQGKRSDKMHKGDIFEAVERIADENTHTKEKEFHIRKHKWSDGRGGKRNPSLYVFDVEKRSRTLGKMLDVLNKEFEGKFIGAKTKCPDLHVSFLVESNPRDDDNKIKDFLSKLTWYVAVAKLPSDGPSGEDLEIIKKVELGMQSESVGLAAEESISK
jgi:hypothetical protein